MRVYINIHCVFIYKMTVRALEQRRMQKPSQHTHTHNVSSLAPKSARARAPAFTRILCTFARDLHTYVYTHADTHTHIDGYCCPVGVLVGVRERAKLRASPVRRSWFDDFVGVEPVFANCLPELVASAASGIAAFGQRSTRAGGRCLCVCVCV